MTMNMQRTIGDSISLRRNITDLGAVDSSLSGIFSPGYAPDEVDRHIHTLFQQDFEEYLRPFPLTRGSIDHWLDLLRSFMPESHRRFDAPLRILDIGSGGGTTVFPLLELYPLGSSADRIRVFARGFEVRQVDPNECENVFAFKDSEYRAYALFTSELIAHILLDAPA